MISFVFLMNKEANDVHYQCGECIVPVQADACGLYPDRVVCDVDYCELYETSDLCGSSNSTAVTCEDSADGFTVSFTCSCAGGYTWSGGVCAAMQGNLL